MPKPVIPINQIEETFLRPIVFKVIEDLQDISALDEDIKVYYPSESEKTPQPGSAMSDQYGYNRLTSDNKILLTVTEEYLETAIHTNMIMGREANPIFLDNNLGVSVNPIYKTMNITINFTVRFSNKELANVWRNRAHTKISRLKQYHLHSLPYGYNVPHATIVILREIHRLREATKPYNEDFDTYFSNHSSPKLTNIVNQAGKLSTLSVAETQNRIQGYFDFDTVPEKGSRENETEATTVSFAYKFRIDKPTDCLMIYPTSIHNQILDERFQILDNPLSHQDVETEYNYRTGILKQFEKTNHVREQSQSNGYILPYYDDFLPKTQINASKYIYSILLSLDSETPNVLMNVLDIPNFDIHPEIVAFLKTEQPWLTKPYLSVFNISLFEDRNLINYSFISIDKNMDIHNTKDLDYRKQYRIRLSVITDLKLLSKEALDRLRENKKVLDLILAIIDPNNKTVSIKGIGKDNQYVPKTELDKVIITNRNSDLFVSMKTVMSLGIFAYRRDLDGNNVTQTNSQPSYAATN